MDDRESAARDRQVVVYTAPFCAPCEQLKRYLSAHDVAFQVRDLMMDEDAQDRLEAAGIRSTPALEVDGVFYAGDALTPDVVDRLLGL